MKKEGGNVFDAIWTREQEELLAEWSEKASCYRWLHNRSEKKYRKGNYLFTIPVIIMSTLTGTANFGIDSIVPEQYKQLAQISIGAVNIFAGLLSTLHNFLHYAENMESHRASDISWSKFQRNISVELALDPKRRKPAGDFLNICRAEYDRLLEQSPPVPETIISQFKKTFKKNTEIHKPDICNGIDPCKIYKLSKEEKAADILLNATQKLRGMYNNLPNHAFKRNNHNNNNNNNNNDNYSNNTNSNNNDQKSENHRETKKIIHNELNELNSVGKVSAFKHKLNKKQENIKKDIDDINEINDIIINIENEPLQEDEIDNNIIKGCNKNKNQISIELMPLEENIGNISPAVISEVVDEIETSTIGEVEIQKITNEWC